MNVTVPSSATRWFDVLAGLSIAGLLVPEAVAYSGIAGLPPQAGVIGLFIGLICYGLLGRSRFAIVSATSSSAAVLAAGTLALAGPAGVSRVALAAMLILLAGGCFLLAGIARLGGLSHLIARPVLRGYTFGLACVIALKQLPHLSALPELHGDFVPLLVLDLLRHAGNIQGFTLAAGVVALLLLFVCERLRRLPGSLVVIVLGVAASNWLAHHGVGLTGTIALKLDGGMPAWPTRAQWLPSVELAAALLLILYAESYGAIRNVALKHGDPVNANRDLLVLGLANVLCGLFHGMPVGAGYSGTSANEAAGARSRLAGLIAAASVLLMVLLLRWIERIPLPVLAAIVIHAVSKSWRLSVFRPYLVWKRDRLLVLAAVLAVLMLGILNGLLVAIAFSLILLLRQLATPRLSVLGRLASGHDFVDIAQHPDAVPMAPDALILRPEEPLFFANAESMFALARQDVQQRSGLTRVILSLEESPDLDSTALEAIADFATWLQGRGIMLRVARLKDDTRALLLRAALPQLSPQALNYWSVEDAVSAPFAKPPIAGTLTL